jgi:hypothetical protein
MPNYANILHYTFDGVSAHEENTHLSRPFEGRVDRMTTKKKRKRLAKASKRGAAQAKQLAAVKTVEEFFALPESTRETLIGVANAASMMRSTGASLSKTAQECGISRRTMISLGGSALLKLKNGRYVVKAHDRLLRVVVVVSNRKGLVEIATRDSRQASKAGKHSAAIQRYLETGDASTLKHFKGKYIIDSNGKRVTLMTDLQKLDRLGSAGVLSFESLYARSL